MSREIIKLTGLWCQIVCFDHHKDRDCHWYINTVYSYGEPPVFRIEHNGYIGGNISGEYKTYYEAERGIVYALQDLIAAEVDWSKNVLADESSWESDQVERAKKIIELTSK